MRVWEMQSGDGVDGLVLADREEREPGPGEVAVAMAANSINYRNLSTIENAGARGIRFPLAPNSDGAGEVTAVGPGVRSVRPGDRVASCFFADWTAGPISEAAMATALGGALDGVLGEQVILKETGIIPVPAHLNYAEASTLPCAGLTAWNCLLEQGEMQAGSTVLLLGTGGVSIFGLQFAAMTGARAIVTSSSDEKLLRAKELGAWETINYRKNPDWEQAVLDLTGGLGVDVTLEVGGGGTLTKSVTATKVGGTVSLVGVLAGGAIDPTLVMRRSIRLQGVYVGSRRMFSDMNAAISANGMHPVIDQSFAFDDAPAAYHAMRAAGHFGKLVIDI
jgi:NADPH:quinone reductase-like Zn-dependent oxidoreductase